MAFIWPLYHKGLVVLLEFSPISIEELWSSVRVTIVFLVIFLISPIAQFGLAANSERVFVIPNFFHLRMMEATVFLGTFKAAELFWFPS